MLKNIIYLVLVFSIALQVFPVKQLKHYCENNITAEEGKPIEESKAEDFSTENLFYNYQHFYAITKLNTALSYNWFIHISSYLPNNISSGIITPPPDSKV